jgi:GT2 family glycosyltransferase
VAKQKRRKTNVKLKIIRLDKNVGPAIARNRGVAKAKGEFVVFLDSDVELFPDTLKNLARIFEEDPDVVALTGVWVKEQHTKAFFPNFKALRDWSYWINERDMSGYYYLFSTRIAAIKRSVFLRLGGFDETYPAPLVEDIELTYRIARRYAIIFAPHVRVRHEFESFWPIAKKYFLRAYFWTKLYKRRKKFDPVATTFWEALTAISGVAIVLLGIASILSLPTLPAVLAASTYVPTVYFRLGIAIYMVFLASLAVHLLMIRRFLFFVYKEKGIVFAVKSFFVGLLLYCFIFAGAIAGRLRT